MTTKPAYIMVPRKLIRIWISVNILLVILIGLSYQYTNYVARQLCGIVLISSEAYKANPNPTATGKLLAKEFDKIRRKYHC